MAGLAGASGSFLVFALVAILVTNLSPRLAWRRTVLLLASLLFLWLSTEGLSLVPLMAFVALGYAGLKWIESGSAAPSQRSAGPIVIATLLIFVWLKKYTFLPSPLFLRFPYTTLGLSYILFRVIHLMEDAASDQLPAKVSLASYLAYTLNFTSIVAGPIQRYQEFDESERHARRPSVIRAGQAIERIIVGFFKASVLALIFSMIKNHAVNHLLAAADWQNRMLAGALAIAVYPFFLYCNFSGYIDIVIGMAQLIGIELPENFDRPFAADSFIDFWSRWHITLSTWLKTYVYNPLLLILMRRFPQDSLAPFWGVLSFFVTFFLVGAWHGQTSAFLFFGVLQGGGVAMNKLYEILLTRRLGRKRVRILYANRLYIGICRGLTFTWFAFTLIWFWNGWQQISRFAATLGAGAILTALLFILVCSTVGIAIWEALRGGLLQIRWREQVILSSRYARTAWCTVLCLILFVTELLLRQQAPEIVYKTF